MFHSPKRALSPLRRHLCTKVIPLLYTDRNSSRRMVKNEGFLTVYQGLGAGIVRQIFYATSRFGLYEVTPCTPCARARRTRTTCSQAHTQANATASCCVPFPSRLPCAQLSCGPPNSGLSRRARQVPRNGLSEPPLRRRRLRRLRRNHLVPSRGNAAAPIYRPHPVSMVRSHGASRTAWPRR